LIGGHLSLTNRASLRPSIDPGICMSVKTIWISWRASRMAIRLVGIAGFDDVEACLGDHSRPADPE
jgi:hypothetical protein